VPICDGCGIRVDDAHLRARIQRLELATRFRPVHIGVLLIYVAPPAGLDDFFYAGADARSQTPRSPYFRELAKLASPRPAPEPLAEDLVPESVLAEFQRRGFFLTSAVECPMRDHGDLAAAIRRLVPTVLRRVQNSYKPKCIALISPPTAELTGPLRDAGWGDRLVLSPNGVPFPDPIEEGEPTEPQTSLANLLLAALPRFS